jgi:hypothetical protein
MSDTARAAVPARLRSLAGEVRTFAEEEGKASGLPGQDQGPADAYRHLVGVAELSRRLGRHPAAAMAEYNEFRSWRAMRTAQGDGRAIDGSNTPEARAMDRHNNRLAIEIGANAASTEDVVMRARALMERAIQSHGGSGRGNTPHWREARYWSDGTGLAGWSPDRWPDLERSRHFIIYRGGIAAGERRERAITGGGPVQVGPHLRNGHPVSGHTRSAPSR